MSTLAAMIVQSGDDSFAGSRIVGDLTDNGPGSRGEPARDVPLAVASKVLRHSQVSITADLYGHLTREVSHAAVDGLAAVLDAAAAERLNE